MAALPDDIKAIAEMSPVEDLFLLLLREKFPGVLVQTLLSQHQQFPLILVRRQYTTAFWRGDPRFIDACSVVIQCLCEDPDGDEDAAILAEAVRVVLRDAAKDQYEVAGRGRLRQAKMAQPPRRVADWATSTGPVQYADLPTGVWRYEATFKVAVRKPDTNPFPLTP